MTESEKLIAGVERYGAHNYGPLKVVLSRGEGARVWDVEGKEYLDFLACYSALNFGHQHPELVKALTEQVTKLAVCSRAFYSEELSYFSEELAGFCGLDSVLTMNSGAEAVESAIKLARKWGYKTRGIPPGKAKIVAMENNFHGRTISIISFSSEPLYRNDFGPFTPGFELVPYGDIDRLAAAIDENTVGVLLEPVQAEAGILVPRPGFLGQVKALCREKKALFILDEIQTGLARTGKNFCWEHEGASPDMIVLGKSLGGGLLPLSAVVALREVMDVLRPGEHGSTFGGNPLACHVGRAVLRLLRQEDFAGKAARIGRQVMAGLNGESLPIVREIRGLGALIGIELHPTSGGARRFCEKLSGLGVLCKETHDYVIRIAPPLVIDEADLASGLDKIIDVIKKG